MAIRTSERRASQSDIGTQAHIPILETTDEGKQALLMGLEYLVNIAFVDDEEVS